MRVHRRSFHPIHRYDIQRRHGESERRSALMVTGRHDRGRYGVASTLAASPPARLLRLAGLTALLLLIQLFLLVPGAYAQNASGITSPASGSSISGDVPVMGTAVIDPFQKYELYYKLEPSGDDAFIYFGGGTSPVVNGQLATWNAAALPPGTYTLRLRVVKLDGNYAEFYAPNLSVNQGPAPTPTSDQPTVTPIPTATFTPAPQPTPVVGEVAQPALEEEEAPLLPTPTPTTLAPLAVVIDPVQPEAAPVQEEAGLTRELGAALSLDRLRQAFFTGVRWSATLFFVILAFYGGKRLFFWVRGQQ